MEITIFNLKTKKDSKKMNVKNIQEAINKIIKVSKSKAKLSIWIGEWKKNEYTIISHNYNHK